MIDSHVHIGQFEDVYYDPLEVVDIVMTTAPGIIDGLAFSSTTSCVEGVAYRRVETEIQKLLAAMPCAAANVRPYFWFIPDYIEQGVSIENAGGGIPYRGIKLHPYAHQWDFNNSRHLESLRRLFDYAGLHRLPVLIHTGNSGVDSANRFEPFFTEYPQTQFILAHCRPFETARTMIAKYSNVYGDTAFMPGDALRGFAASGLKHKIIFGTDFPITHYFRTKFPRPDETAAITLKEQYEDMLNIDIAP